MEQNNITNNITIDLDWYIVLLTAEYELKLAKVILFYDCNRLNFDKNGVYFDIDEAQVKLVFPCDYKLHLIGLQKKEGENV